MKIKIIKMMSGVIFPLLFGLCMSVGTAYAADKPNILFIMTDDVGITNVSAYSRGLMGYQTPNIDRLAFCLR